MYIRCFVILCLCLVLPMASLQANAQVVNHQVSGSLQPNHALACIALDDAKSDYTPADLYPAVAACIVDNRMIDAVNLMAVAGAYGMFDRLRVVDKTAHQATTVLQMTAYADLSDAQRESFTQVLEKEAIDPKAIQRRCEKFSRLGPPRYQPDYMIRHGMGAFTGKYGNGLEPNFDPEASWEQVRASYLKCPSALPKGS